MAGKINVQSHWFESHQGLEMLNARTFLWLKTTSSTNEVQRKITWSLKEGFRQKLFGRFSAEPKFFKFAFPKKKFGRKEAQILFPEKFDRFLKSFGCIEFFSFSFFPPKFRNGCSDGKRLFSNLRFSLIGEIFYSVLKIHPVTSFLTNQVALF